MDIKQSEQVATLLNKIATFERSKRLTDAQKALLIKPLQEQIETITGQSQLGLEGGGHATGSTPQGREVDRGRDGGHGPHAP